MDAIFSKKIYNLLLMSQKKLESLVDQSIFFSAPNLSRGENLFLKGARLCRSGLVLYRRIRYLTNPKDAVSFAMGTLVSHHPTVKQIARFVFGSLSVLRCVKDLHRLTYLLRSCRKIVRGEQYVPIKDNNFKRKGRISPSTIDRLFWKKQLFQARSKFFFITVVEIFKTLGKLVCHLADVYSAYNDDIASEVFVHSRQLWNELAAPDTVVLLEKLKKTSSLNDRVFQLKGLSLTTKILIEILQLPAKVAPLKKDAKEKIKNVVQTIEEKIQEVKHQWYEWQGIPKEYLCEDSSTIPVKIERRLFTL